MPITRSERAILARAATLPVEEIATQESNRAILRQLRRNSDRVSTLTVFDPEEQVAHNYSPEGGTDFGWIGYFLGQNTSVETFEMCCDDIYAEGNEKFFRGLSHNTSIRDASFGRIVDPDLAKWLAAFLKNNSCLKELELYECDLEASGWSALSRALAGSSSKSLQRITLRSNTIEDEQLVALISALRTAPVSFSVEDLTVGLDGALALANDAFLQLDQFILYRGDVRALMEGLPDICDANITRGTANCVDVEVGWGEPMIDDDPGWSESYFTCQLSEQENISTSMRAMFENIPSIQITLCNLGVDGWRSLAVAMGSCTSTSLKTISFDNNTIPDAQLAEIVLGLSVHPQLRKISFSDMNNIGSAACTALGTLIQNTATALKTLHFGGSTFSDDGLEALLGALQNHTGLETLHLPELSGSRHYQALARVLESPRSNLKMLSIGPGHIRDPQVIIILRALANNQSLTRLFMVLSLAVAAQCNPTLSQVLCDTSSVNKTYFSNHTLGHFYITLPRGEMHDESRYYLHLNGRYSDKGQVAIAKILKNHPDLDMRPFFEWDLKVLPLAVKWLEKASRIQLSFDANIEGRKLCAIYQFVRGMPELCISTLAR